ncbi:MAG: hypothetical protein LBU94_01070 [Clostridiales bacterium]|nr:hypothetical protein [Clostridiales bacterium]
MTALQDCKALRCGIWTDENGNTCIINFATDYYLPVNAGEELKVVHKFSDRNFAKKDGISGWVRL